MLSNGAQSAVGFEQLSDSQGNAPETVGVVQAAREIAENCPVLDLVKNAVDLTGTRPNMGETANQFLARAIAIGRQATAPLVEHVGQVPKPEIGETLTAYIVRVRRQRK